MSCPARGSCQSPRTGSRRGAAGGDTVHEPAPIAREKEGEPARERAQHGDAGGDDDELLEVDRDQEAGEEERERADADRSAPDAPVVS